MKPRLGFLGVGWIGRHRMQAVAESGLADIVAIADSSESCLTAAHAVAPKAALTTSYDALLEHALDGVVIATPSAMHAEQTLRALARGLAVFCQKPLGRNAREVAAVVGAARAADRLLGIDLSYRHTAALAAVNAMVRSGELGRVYAAELAFHNAYGPDKSWFYDRTLSGGGCLVDLGTHLIDAALWTLGFPAVERVTSTVFSCGERQEENPVEVEDYAMARLDLASGAAVQIACSWRLHAGQDAVIRASFYGTHGAVEMRNVDGSFYDFVAERYNGTRRVTLTDGADAWGGRAAVAWADELTTSRRFAPSAEELVRVAEIVDAVYANARRVPS